ncbi:MAG: NADH-quinone oxidoreductase subunit NuoK [Gemmatimonadetes bacterium]|nr:MAG: NADH-quinone oxidoreductase subunit NuoK [Gemmatimonadota bacterium]
MTIGLTHYLVVSSALFVCGVMAMVTRKNAVAILMGVELMLNAAAVNFVAFAHYVGGSGQVFAVFIIVLAAAEAVIALAIVLGIYQNIHTIEVDRLTQLKD